MEPLHEVTREELPVLFEWVTKHLPHTYKLYETINAELKGIWHGPTYFTLGWPDILAVGDGPVDPSKCKCADFFNGVRHTCVYAPNNDHLEELITRPEFLDWTKPILFYANCHENMDVVERISNATGTKYNKRYVNNLMAAYPGDIRPRPVPEGFEIRSLDPDLHSAYITSTWPFRRPHTESYISEALKAFPSIGVFDRDGNLIGLELILEFGLASLLHVKEEFRGRGIATCIVSQLAQKRFQENQPFLAAVLVYNQKSLAVHQKLGFKTLCKFDWFVHSMTAEKVLPAQNW